MSYPFVVMCPYYGNKIPAHLDCIEELKERGVPFLPLQDQPYLDVARSVLCTEALKQMPDAKALFFVDHDIIFTADDIIGMVERLLKHDLDVTGAGYSMRRPGSIMSCRPLDAKKIDFYVEGFTEAKWVATGFTAINRRVFQRLDEVTPELYCTSTRKDFRPYFERYIKDNTYHVDDVGFCYRVRDMGMRVWIDQLPRIYHRGAYDYAIEDCGMVVPDVLPPFTVVFEE